MVTADTGMPGYDFRLAELFACRRPWQRQGIVDAVARMGATGEYGVRYDALLRQGVRLVHTPSDHNLCSRLPDWFPLLSNLTPRSVWFEQPPTAEDVLSAFALPVFLKGERQTSRHQRHLSIIETADQLRSALDTYAVDPLLRWQRVACRQYIPLRSVAATSEVELPRAFEFRTFWWDGVLVAVTPYWTDVAYALSDDDRLPMLAIAAEAARRVPVRFLVVDVAQTVTGRWIVIELNDGQDSGYRAASPLSLWRRVLDVERERIAGPKQARGPTPNVPSS